MCGFSVSQNGKLVLGIRNTIAFNHAPNARQFRSALSEKTYMRKAELPRQIFLLFCCKYCCSVHSSKDNSLHSFTWLPNFDSIRAKIHITLNFARKSRLILECPKIRRLGLYMFGFGLYLFNFCRNIVLLLLSVIFPYNSTLHSASPVWLLKRGFIVKRSRLA